MAVPAMSFTTKVCESARYVVADCFGHPSSPCPAGVFVVVAAVVVAQFFFGSNVLPVSSSADTGVKLDVYAPSEASRRRSAHANAEGLVPVVRLAETNL